MNREIEVTRALWRAIAILLVLAAGAVVSSAHGAGVAMVTDLTGKASVSSGSRTRDLTILAELDAGAKVELGAGATLVALYLETGDEYVLKGPATIEFKPGEPVVPSGARPEKRSLSLGKGGKDVKIRQVGMAQGAMVMRSVRTEPRIALLTLNRTLALSVPLEFRWKELQPGARYAFTLSDDSGRLVAEAAVDGTSYVLPASIAIRESLPYTWQVAARLPDGKKYSNSGEFTLASADLRSRAEALRPGPSALLSTRVAYAAWLDQEDLRDEARKYWKAAAAERPDDPRLKALAGD
jgi:hypothetical protein